MNKKILGVVIVIIIFVLAGYFLVNKEQTPKIIGGDRDIHGCLGPAGYGWSEEVGACIRSFEMTPDIMRAARIAVDHTGRAYALTVVSFNSYEEVGAYDIMLERGEERVAETVNIKNWQVVTNTPTKEGTTAVLNQKILNKGIYITPLQVVSDSRCSAGVQCIWAGEILIKVKLEKGTASKEVELKEGGSVVFEGNNVSFVSLIPENKTKPVTPEKDYQFTFKVVPVPVNNQGTVSGKVTTSPTCPVERIPPDPNCVPKPYATSINILKDGKMYIVNATQSDGNGAFNINLDPGTYTLQARGGSVLPRCADVLVKVISGQKTTADISCDTGIR